MRELRFSSSRYGVALVDGAYAVQRFGGDIETQAGPIPRWNNQDLLYLDAQSYGQLVRPDVIGASSLQQPDRAVLWVDDWIDRGQVLGTNPVAIDEDSRDLTCVDGYRIARWDHGVVTDMLDIATGSQGIRYVDNGVPVTGDQTYWSPDLALSEFTQRGEIAIGIHSTTDVLAVRFPNEPAPRQIAGGVCRNVRFYRDGDQCAIAYAVVTPNDATCVLLWATVDELHALPYVGDVPVPPNPEPEPEPEPNPPEPNPGPEPEPTPMPESLRDHLTPICFAVINLPYTQAEQCAQEAIDAADEAVHRAPTDFEAQKFATSRESGHFWEIGTPPPGDPNWRAAYMQWMKARG